MLNFTTDCTVFINDNHGLLFWLTNGYVFLSYCKTPSSVSILIILRYFEVPIKSQIMFRYKNRSCKVYYCIYYNIYVLS